VDAALMLAPFDSGLHDARSAGRLGRCQWAGHPDAEESEVAAATWSAVWNGERWAVCDRHLAALARAEMTRPTTAGPGASGFVEQSPGIDLEASGGHVSVPLEKRFELSVLADLDVLRGRYDPHVFRQMVRMHGGVGAAKRLLDDPRHTSYGFEKLWELGELERSVEFAVLLPWFRDLFTPQQQEKAEHRLILHDFPLEQRLAAHSAAPPACTEDI